jgi:hypothetical protein
MKLYLTISSNKNSIWKIISGFIMIVIILLFILVFDFTGNRLFAVTVCFAENSTKNSVNDVSKEDLPGSIEGSDIGSTLTKALVFPDELARFFTSFSVSDQTNRNRAYNMRLICSKINGKIVNSGEIFSFNKTTGPRTKALGYRDAWIYVNGNMVKDTGGGVCQVSSTLYNAVLLADLQVVERRNHMFEVSYVKKGMDATVFYGSQDFKFKNTSSDPIKIQCSVSKNNKLTFILKGTRVETSKTVSYESKLLKTIPYTTTEKYDPVLVEGKRVYEGHKGVNGYIVDVYKIYKDKATGKTLSRTKLYTNSYKPYNAVILVGTKKAVKPVVTPAPSIKPSPTPDPSVTPEPDLESVVTPSPNITPTPAPTDEQNEQVTPSPEPID